MTLKPCISVSSLEALSYTLCPKESVIISPIIDAKHGNIYSAAFEFQNGNYKKIIDFGFENIENFLKKLNNLKKKIFFVGNCGILYKDVIKSCLKCEVEILEDSSPTSKHVGIAAFDKFKAGFVEDSEHITALYIKKSSAEEQLRQ